MSYTLQQLDEAIDGISPSISNARADDHAWPSIQRVGALKQAAIEYVANINTTPYDPSHIKVISEALADYQEHNKILPVEE